MTRKIDLITQVKKIVLQDWIAKLAPLGLLKLLRIPHFSHNPKVNVVVKLLFSFVHDGYVWLEGNINLNIDVIHKIMGLSKVGSWVFVGKKLDRKLVAKLTQELKLTKGTIAYDSIDIEDRALCFTIQLLVGWVLRKF